VIRLPRRAAAAPLVTVAEGAPADAAARKPDRSSSKAKRAAAPAGYVELEVGGIVATPRGHAVILTDPGREIVIPIFIGGSEALTIDLRQNKRRYARPLTHDLLDEVMRRLGGQPVKVQIDDIRNDTFIGSIFVRRGNEVIEIDARPSDAIAIALGHRVPIFVAAHVLDTAGIRKDEVIPADPSQPNNAPKPI
jgi:bifunctional DNase/RNase